MMVCKSICSRIQSEKVIGFHKKQRYCADCTYYATTIERFCFCCKNMFRTTRRNNKRRQSGVWNEKNE